MEKVLILGGTQFIGRVLVEQLLETEDYSVTLFNRGKTNPHLFPELRKIKGDRETDDIRQLAKEDWDCVIDFSGYYPDSLEKLVRLLKGKIGRYVFASSVSAYKLDEYKGQLIDETFETHPTSADSNSGSYGERKAECERVLFTADWLDKIIFRPSIVYGKYDPTGRFYYWLYRVKTQKEIILPNKGVEKGNYTFVEDLAQLLIQAIKIEEHTIAYNTSTHKVMPFRNVLASMEAAFNNHPKYINASPSFLSSRQIKPSQDIPLWFNGDNLMVDNSKVTRELGVAFTPFDASVSKTIAYYDQGQWKEGKAGIPVQREKELIKELTAVKMEK